MVFEVKLIRVPSLDSLSGWDVFELMASARHVAADFWIFEGDEEALRVDDVEVVATGSTCGIDDLDDGELVEHCEQIFGVQLKQCRRAWRMLHDHRRKDRQ